MSKYEYTPEMHEISGFGGGYEETCRAMVIAGLEFLDTLTEKEPEYSELENVFGLIRSNNETAKELDKAIVAASDNDCTGAMHHASVQHILFIRKYGWDKYVEEMSKPKEEQDSDE